MHEPRWAGALSSLNCDRALATCRIATVAARTRGRWPYGRTNHYLFDMNRDWMVGVAPETRGRWKVLLEWRPHLFIDAHEMSGMDTYLFYPQSHPRHPAIDPAIFEWQGRFAADCAHDFDRHGWGYYTREWADAWYPAYSDAWGSLNGAVGMLYEQGRVGGQPLMRASGEVVSYRESVHGQVVASLANLRTLARDRDALLADYLANRSRNVDPAGEAAARAYLIDPRRQPRACRAVGRYLVAAGHRGLACDERLRCASGRDEPRCTG